MSSKNSISFFKDMKRRSTINSNKIKSSKERLSSISLMESTLRKSAQKSFSDIDFDTLPSEQKLEVSFHNLNKWIFFKILEACLRYDPESRSTVTVRKIMNLTKNIKFFQEISQKYGEKVCMQCCKYIRKEFYPQDHILFNQGSIT